MIKLIFSILITYVFCLPVNSQTMTQSVRGTVFDDVTKSPLAFANVIVTDTDPLMGTTTDIKGDFVLPRVPVGRHTLKITMMGYETSLIRELLISAGHAPNLTIGMHQTVLEMEGLTVRVNKKSAINTMSTVSSRQFTVEETQRYAGGMDDPARLASSFAGVATPSVSSNGISVRGNNPEGLLWRIEGVEAPNPNHFADLTVVGGGLLTALSNQVLGNSDFFTGAFPAEYGNAHERSHTFQAGIIGIDFGTEGPFVQGKDASYIMNYRYSTLGLITPMLPDDAGVLKYQDLSFKTRFPTRNAGTFSFWGVGALDGQAMTAADSVDWKSQFDRDDSETSLYMFASGLSHKITLNSSTFLNTTLSAAGNGLTHREKTHGL